MPELDWIVNMKQYQITNYSVFEYFLEIKCVDGNMYTAWFCHISYRFLELSLFWASQRHVNLFRKQPSDWIEENHLQHMRNSLMKRELSKNIKISCWTSGLPPSSCIEVNNMLPKNNWWASGMRRRHDVHSFSRFSS